MNRTFATDVSDDGPAGLPERPLSRHPNYITPQGLERLRHELADAEQRLDALDAASADPLERAQVARHIRWLQSRVGSAIPIEAAAHGDQRVGFGATVTLADPNDRELRYRIVGEDEADPEHGLVSWLSPLARALEGAQVGDSVIWKRPVGDLEVEVIAIASAGGRRSEPH